MTTPTPGTHVRRPAGSPVGGQFAGKTPSLPEVTLSRADTSLLSIGMGELPDELPQVTTERNTRMRFTASAAVAAALAGALTFSLTGCASDNAAPAPTSTSSEVATPTPTPDVSVASHAVGTVVDAETAKNLNAAKGETRAWKLADGTWVTTNVHEELPQSVIDSVVASVPAGNSDHQPTGDGKLASVTSQLGKFTCIVSYGIPDPRGIEWDGFGWTASITPNYQTYSTQEEAVAHCQAAAADAGASDRLAIFTFMY